MKRIPLLVASLVLLPSFAHAQTVQALFKNLLTFFNTVLIPFLIGVAFLFFAWNAIRFFVIQGHTDEGQTSAKNLALYGVLALVVLIIFWGLINFLAVSIGLEGKTAPTSDYVEKIAPAAPSASPVGGSAAGNARPCAVPIDSTLPGDPDC